MSAIRIMSQGTTNDVGGLRKVADQLAAMVEQDEPGTTTYECFLDETTSQVIWFETYQDAEAMQHHLGNLQSSGLMEDLMAVYEPARIVCLSPVTDERVTGILSQFGAARMTQVVGQAN